MGTCGRPWKRKARFIAQVMRGRLDVREIEDIGDAALSYNEVKALATGNPLLMDKAEADAELTRLQRAERAHHRNRDALRYKITSAEKRIDRLAALSSDIDTAVACRRDTRGDAFTMTIEGIPYGKRNHAGRQLLQLLDREVTALAGSGRPRIEARLGHLGGFGVTAATCRVLGTTQLTVALDGAPESEIRLTAADLAGTDPAGLVIRLENRLTGLESLKARTAAEIGRLRIEAARARDDIEKPFPQSGQLAEARDRVRRIEEQLKEATRAQQQDDHGPAVAAAGMRDAPGRLTSASDANGAGGSRTATASDGAPWMQPAIDRPVPGSSQARNGTSGHQQPGAVTVSQCGFPESNPLAGQAGIGTAVVPRSAAPAERSARPTR